MSDPRFMRAVVVGWRPDGKSVLLQFKFEDNSQTDVWVRTQDIAQVLLLIQSASERASAIAVNTAGGTRQINMQKIAKLLASNTDDHIPFVEVTFESGLQIHMEMGAKTAKAFAEALAHLTQNKPTVTKH
jgi:hypothetical protein